MKSTANYCHCEFRSKLSPERVTQVCKTRHHLQIEDLKNLITYCEGCDGSTIGSLLRNCEIARLLHVSEMTVHAWMNKKNCDIPHIRIGGRRGIVRFPKPWLLEWARKREEAIKKFNFEL